MATFEEAARAYFSVDFDTVHVRRDDTTWKLSGAVSGTLDQATDYDSAITEADALIGQSIYTRLGQWLITRDEETTGARALVAN